MADEKDLVIEIPADDAPVVTADKDPARKDAKPEGEARSGEDEAVESLKGQVKTLTERAEAERLARERSDAEAQRQREEAARAREIAEKARGEVVETRTSAVDNAIAAAQAEAEAATRDYEAADAAGDSKAKADAQRKIARAEAKLLRFEEAKDDLETQQVRRTEERERQPERRPAASDAFEAVVAQATPRSAQWLRAHPEYVTDEKLNRKANAAHNMAIAEGHAPDTDAYFEYCETFLGLREAKQEEPGVDEQPETPPARPLTKPKRNAMPSAPVSRDNNPNPSNGNLGAGQVVLTPGEQRAATDGTLVYNFDDPSGKFKKGDPIGLKEFARRKAALQKQGAYDRAYTDQ